MDYEVEAASGDTAYAESIEDAQAAAFTLLTDGCATPITVKRWQPSRGEYVSFGTYNDIG